MLFDTHVHLNDQRFDADRGDVLARARAAGVTSLVEVADAPAEWDRALALAAAHPGFVWCALGLHPYHAEEWSPRLGEALAAKARAPGVVAAGEIGLDYAKCQVPPARQREAFLGMLEAAETAGLPVVIHCREAYADLLEVLRARYGAAPPAARFRGVVHCFSGTAAQALECAALGFALGIDGPVTYPRNEPLRQTLREAGLARLVLETDSPWLPPQPKRGQRCEPADVAAVAAALAGALGMSVDEVARVTSRNARELYRLEDVPAGAS